MKNILIVSIIIILSGGLIAQARMDFEQEIGISLERANLYPFFLRVHIPTEIKGRQTVINTDYSAAPDKFDERLGRFYAVYNSSSLKTFKKIKVKSSLILYRNDLYTAKKRGKPINIETDLSPYLQREINLQINSKSIQEVALSLKGDDFESSVKNVFNFVVNHLEYKIFNYQDRSAKKALRQGKGDCTEYTELMIALCRSIGIPARYVNGYIAQTRANTRHNWVEVYFPKYGWVAFDPTFADSNSGKTTFEKMQNIYIYNCFTRSDKYVGLKIDKNEYFRIKHKLTTTYGKYSSPKLSFQYRAVNLGDDKIYKTLQRYEAKSKAEKKSLIDSLINLGFKDYKLYKLRAMIYLENDELELALSDLQRAVAFSKNEYQKSQIYFGFIVFYIKKERYESAIKFLHEILENNNLKPDEILNLIEGPAFAVLRKSQWYPDIADALELEYEKVKKNIRQKKDNYLIYCIQRIENGISPECSEGVEFNGTEEMPSKELIIQNRIKRIRGIFNDDTSLENHFSEDGKLIYRSRKKNDKIIYWDSIYYNDKKISITSFEHLRKRVSKVYIDIEDGCFSKITSCLGNCKEKETQMSLVVDRTNPYCIITSIIDSAGKEQIRNSYCFDKEGKPLGFTKISETDTTRYHWVYDGLNETFYINDRVQSYTKRNENGQLVDYERNDDSENKFFFRYEYNKQQQCISYVNSYGAKTNYEYDKNGLIKLITSFIQKKLNSKVTYEYEYYK